MINCATAMLFDVAAFIGTCADVENERCWIVSLDARDRFAGHRAIPASSERNLFSIYGIVKPALNPMTSGFYVVRHSLFPEPDAFDEWLFDIMCYYSKLFGKFFCDYVIFSEEGPFSFRDAKRLFFQDNFQKRRLTCINLSLRTTL